MEFEEINTGIIGGFYQAIGICALTVKVEPNHKLIYISQKITNCIIDLFHKSFFAQLQVIDSSN